MTFWHNKWQFDVSGPVTFNHRRGRFWDVRHMGDGGAWVYQGRRFYPLGTRRATIILEVCDAN